MKRLLIILLVVCGLGIAALWYYWTVLAMPTAKEVCHKVSSLMVDALVLEGLDENYAREQVNSNFGSLDQCIEAQKVIQKNNVDRWREIGKCTLDAKKLLDLENCQ